LKVRVFGSGSGVSLTKGFHGHYTVGDMVYLFLAVGDNVFIIHPGGRLSAEGVSNEQLFAGFVQQLKISC
jgi:hypothetical protein